MARKRSGEAFPEMGIVPDSAEGLKTLPLPYRYGVGITAFTWFEYVLSNPVPSTAVVT